MAPKISSRYANSKDPNMGMHEAGPNMSKHGARFYPKKKNRHRWCKGRRRSWLKLAPRIWLFEQNRLIMVEPWSVGALDAEMICWMGHVVEEWLNEWISSHWKGSFGGKSNSTHFFIDESWIPWSDTPTQWNQQDLASQIFTSHKRLHDRLHMLHQKLLARSLPTVTSTTQRLRLGQLKTTKLPTSPLINAGCSGVRPMSEQIWFWKRYLVNELQLRWMHYHW